MLLKVSVWIQLYLKPNAAPLGVDIFSGVRKALDEFVYNTALSLAAIHWSLLRAFIMMGHVIERINIWLSEEAFSPLIAANNTGMRSVFVLAFVIALFVLGITYMIAVFIRLDVVNFQSAITWYVAGALFFSLGPSLYEGMNELRQRVSTAFYLSTLQGIENEAGGTFDFGSVAIADLGLGVLCDYLGPYLPGASYTTTHQVDGLDVALAYLHADGVDVMGSPYPVVPAYCPYHNLSFETGEVVGRVPTAWFMPDGYFDINTYPGTSVWEDDADVRSAAINQAWQSHGRMLTAWSLVLFGIVEQMVYLLLTIAMGITFMIFGVAVMFGFFRRTEGIANAVVNQWIELIVQTVVIGMLQALVVGFFLMGTASGHALVVLAVGLVCLLLMVIVLWSGVKAVWNSLNRLFDALGQGAGQVFVRPGQATTLAAAGASYGMSKASGAANLTSSALTGMRAMQQGATRMQAVGMMLGGSQALSGVMRTMARTPGLQGTPIAEAADQFVEGASVRAIAKHIPKPMQMMMGTNLHGGVALLTDRDPSQAEYDAHGQIVSRPMLLPAVGDRLENWTTPRMGSFTPDALQTVEAERNADALEARQQHDRMLSTYESVGEELEQTAQTTDESKLNEAASSLTQAAQDLQRGVMRVQGGRDVASVIADALRLLGQDRTSVGGTRRDGVDHLTAGRYVAEAMGVKPVMDQAPIGGADLARLGMFINQAVGLGLSPRQVEGMIGEVKASPSGQLREGVRDTLVQVVKADGNRSWADARREVERLEIGARNLPQGIAAYGMVRVEPQIMVKPQVTVNTSVASDAYDEAAKQQSMMSGSGSVLGMSE